jgi:hypothetical protein
MIETAYNPYIYENFHYEEEIEEKKPLSFNLDAEAKRAREAFQSGSEVARKLARDGFVNNVMYWAREYIGDIKTMHYYWEIEESDEGVRLFHPQYGYADDMEKNALREKEIPEYERKRREIEHEVGQLLTQELGHAQVGDTFIHTSPPPEGVENEIYGGYSITHTYEVTQVENKKILSGRDVKNYLSNDNHKLLLEAYAKQSIFDDIPASNEILGTLVKVERGVSTLDIEESIRFLEKPPVADGATVIDEKNHNELFESQLNKVKSKFMEMYYDLEQLDLDRQKFEKKFMEPFEQVYINSEMAKLAQQDISEEERDELVQQIMGGYEEKINSGGSCGEGIGFSESVYGYEPSMISIRVIGEIWDEHGGLEFPCQHCKKMNRRPFGTLLNTCGEGQVGGCGKSVRC